MAKLGFLKRIIKEDFKREDQELVAKLAYILNPAFESIVNTMSNQLTFQENLNTQVKDISVRVDASGKPINEVSFRSSLHGLCRGIWTVRAQNITDPTKYANSYPLVSFMETDSQIYIKNITGLTANQEYLLRIIATV